jgi:hypothetical protein
MDHFGGPRAIRGLSLRLIGVVLLIAACSGERGSSSGPVVIELNGRKMTSTELRMQFNRTNGPGSFDKATAEQKEEFLRTIADKEVLLAAAREKVGALTAEDERQIRLMADDWLLRGLDFAVMRPVMSDSTLQKRMRDSLNRQILCDWAVMRTDSLARIARDEVVAGKPFEDVARRYSIADPKIAKDGHLDWTSTEMFGTDFSNELFIQEREPGYLSEIRKTPRGYEFYQVKGYRPFDMSNVTHGPETVKGLIGEILTNDRMRAWTDSLAQAHGAEIVDDGLTVLLPGMTAYVDSLARYYEQTHQRPAGPYKPPLSHYDAQQRQVAVAKVDGKPVTIGEIVAGLENVSTRMWPIGPTGVDCRTQIKILVMRPLRLQYARAKGYDKVPEYLLACQMDREKVLLGKLSQQVNAGLPPATDADIQAYYDAHREEYTQKDKLFLSYVVFPAKGEAVRFHSMAKDSSSKWWGARLAEFTTRSEIKVVSNSPEIDPNNPPAELKEVVAEARDKVVNQVVGPSKVPDGWLVARIAYNEHAGMIPLDRIKDGLAKKIGEQRVDEAMQKVIDDGRSKYKLALYPEKLKTVS